MKSSENSGLTDEKLMRRPGRPPVSVDGSKRVAVTTRIMPRAKRGLEETAKATGRSIGDVASSWIEAAYEGRTGVDELLGGDQIAASLKAMAALTADVRANLGEPTTSPAARDAMLAGWDTIMRTTLPFVPPSETETALAEKRAEARLALHVALKALTKLANDHPEMLGSETPSMTRPRGMFAGRPATSTADWLAQLIGGAPLRSLIATLTDYVVGDALVSNTHTATLKALSDWTATQSDCVDEVTEARERLQTYDNAASALKQERAASYRVGMDLASTLELRGLQWDDVRRQALETPAED